MKATKFLTILAILLLFVLALPGSALAAGEDPSSMPDEFIFGQNYTLANGQTINGNLWVFGGNVTIENGATVKGDVNAFGGNLVIDGNITGNINVTGGSVLLSSTAVVDHDINLTGGSLNRQDGARVNGNINELSNSPIRFPDIRIPWFGVRGPWGPTVEVNNPFWGILGYLARAFLVSALAVLVAMFLPRQTERTGRAIVTQPLISGGMGCITVLVAPIILLGLAITILLIPVSFLGFVALVLMIVFGWIGLGLEVGQRMAQMFKTEWALPVAAGLGTLILTLVVDGIGKIWCVGWIAPALVGLVALGGVLLTRFGTQAYTGPTPPAPMPVSPVSPVTPVSPASPVIAPEHEETVMPEKAVPEEPIPPAGDAFVSPYEENASGESPTVTGSSAEILPAPPEGPETPPEQTQ